MIRSGRQVPQLIYADDGLMLSTDAGGMHRLCAVLVLFCMRSHMRVNLKPGKTEMMIFAVSDSVRAALKAANTFIISGQPVRFVSQYKYLGCQVCQPDTLSGA